MKLQHLAVIFIIIMLPISLIISAYTQSQIDTLILQNQYDAKLSDATFDAIKAFDLNTTSNSNSNVADTLRLDIEAAISTFMKSMASSMGAPGSDDSYIRPYVPAILFTLYDGYYIYTPTLNNEGKYEYALQPYNYYSIRYKYGSNTDVVINYTLDNYIVIYGYVNGKYETKSGYLTLPETVEESESIFENVPVGTKNGQTTTGVTIGKRISDYVEVTDSRYITDNGNENSYLRTNSKFLYPNYNMYYIDSQSAKKYYEESYTFTEWVKSNLGNLTPSNAIIKNDSPFSDNTKIFDISPTNNPEKINSNFTQHRIDVIKTIIQDNLNYVISAYANYSGANADTAYNFRLPEINSNEWIRIATNICMVPFVQGMPVGTRFYNNYTVVQSTTNKFYVSPENIYFINKNGDGSYHRIDCPHLLEGGDNITGYSNYDFNSFIVDISDIPGRNTERVNYWRRFESACYYCIVSDSYDSTIKKDDYGNYTWKDKVGTDRSNLRKAYYTAIAREKQRQYTTTNYFE